MKVFTVYKEATGKILRTCKCPDAMVSLQYKESDGEAIVMGISNDRIQKVADGKIIDKLPEEIDAIVIPSPDAQPFRVTRLMWQDVINKLESLKKIVEEK